MPLKYWYPMQPLSFTIKKFAKKKWRKKVVTVFTEFLRAIFCMKNKKT